MEQWSWNTVANRFIEIINVSLDEVEDQSKADTPATGITYGDTDLVNNNEIIQIRRLIYEKL